MKPNALVKAIQSDFEAHLNDEQAIGMKAYMKDQFDFLGIKKPERTELEKKFRPVFKSLADEDWPLVIRQLWKLPFREYQYTAMELMRLRAKQLNAGHVPLLEFMIGTRTWWDTVDFIATNLAGELLRVHPDPRSELIEKWTVDDNFWFHRTCILFQLKYKSKTDKKLLFALCARYADEREFFMRKAIGWALREYGKHDPESVRRFIAKQPLSGLSLREASRYL